MEDRSEFAMSLEWRWGLESVGLGLARVPHNASLRSASATIARHEQQVSAALMLGGITFAAARPHIFRHAWACNRRNSLRSTHTHARC